jgi:hypothetical protein
MAKKGIRMSKESRCLDKFGRLITERLRDRGLEHFEFLAKKKWKAPGTQALQDAVAALGKKEQELVRRCLRAALDSAIHDFLFTLQEGGFRGSEIAFLVDGTNVAEASDGIHAEQFGKQGWFARHSKFGEPPESD